MLRPTLVLAPQAYGGAAMLRAAAASPFVGVAVCPEAPIQTVSIEDVAAAVVAAANGEVPPRTIADLTEAEARPLTEVIASLRAWLGLPPWRRVLRAPPPMARALGRIADGFGWLGWRSPLRTTALKVLETGVTGDPAAGERAGGAACRPLRETLDDLPATRQELWFARLSLLAPLIFAVLSLFWISSGVIGAISWREAAGILTGRGFPDPLAASVVLAGALVDVMLGAALLVRRWARAACIGMVAASLAYLAGAVIWAPDLWADPLGPMMKVWPGVALALVAYCLLEER